MEENLHVLASQVEQMNSVQSQNNALQVHKPFFPSQVMPGPGNYSSQTSAFTGWGLHMMCVGIRIVCTWDEVAAVRGWC